MILSAIVISSVNQSIKEDPSSILLQSHEYNHRHRIFIFIPQLPIYPKMKLTTATTITSLLLPFTLFTPLIHSLPTTNLITTTTIDQPSWSITNYTEGCSPAGCIYTMTITSPPLTPNSIEPAFTTTCQGSNIATEFQACADPALSTREVLGFLNVTLIVQHVFEKGDARYTIRGNATIKVPGAPKTFEVPELEIWGVA